MNTSIRIPSQEEAALAKLCSQELAGVLATNGDEQSFSFTDKLGNTHALTLPKPALTLFIEVLTQLGEGNIVQITPIHAELTTQQAADMLNMSRPTFIRLLDEKIIPFSRTGNRRKVSYSDVMKYKEELLANRLASLEELSALDQESDMGY
ncbi:helix-turn-helix domain-containing protein [Marinomonas spartinae]|uniref:helix-turn-helix domain-containing protein n=1 Tax=Marinomonas spartinae TaxID=1792290 RepID=UPI0018F1EDD4|nr:helix-turn-helix domain-containing protein [Marinomonas spartinae]MBJ7556412.1 helix-turn-helix domain-containing protein [Marinomonas spartinae]